LIDRANIVGHDFQGSTTFRRIFQSP
jgi:hypothetical protein